MAGCGDGPPAARGAEPVVLQGEDGRKISGALYTVDAESPPGLILLPMYQADPASWEPFCKTARRHGYMSLAINLPGPGGNAGRDAQSAAPPGWEGAYSDVAQAKHYLVERGADPSNIAILGASIGANIGFLYAHRDPDIQGVVMLSPGIEYGPFNTESVIDAFRTRPVMILVAEGDSYAYESSRRLKRRAPNFADLRVYPGTSHGTDLLDVAPDRTREILAWLDQVIGPGAGAPRTPGDE